MSKEEIEDNQTKISKMGFYELMDYKQIIINSLLENSAKFFLYDLVDERLLALDVASSKVVFDDSDFDMEA